MREGKRWRTDVVGDFRDESVTQAAVASAKVYCTKELPPSSLRTDHYAGERMKREDRSNGSMVSY